MTWVANHLRPQTRLEMKPTGTGFAPRTRITQFVNVPEMSRMWRQMAGLVTRDDLDVTLPAVAVAGGARHTVALPRTAEQTSYAQQLDARVAAIKSGAVRPEDDNMLAVTGDGRKAALDPRLVGLPAPLDGGRSSAGASSLPRDPGREAERQRRGAGPYRGEQMEVLRMIDRVRRGDRDDLRTVVGMAPA